jgi:hypothetical protein
MLQAAEASQAVWQLLQVAAVADLQMLQAAEASQAVRQLLQLAALADN